MAVKKTQMYRRNLDGTETNLNPLTESQYVLMENGQTVQEVLSDRDSDKYTPVIINSSSTFKVGQGDNVDLSSSMKEGAYDSCVLKGKTMVNCIQEPSSKDVVLPYEFADGRYVTINDTKESGALGVELKGQTLVNLVPKKIIDYTASSDWDGYHQLVQNSKQSFDQWRALQDLKPNTKYYISCYVETFEVVNNEGYRLNNPSVESIFGDSMIVNGVGRYQWLSTTKSELTDEIFMALRCQNAFARGAIKIRDIMIIEYQQGMENWDIPYFEGMASCKMPILRTIGKNLWNNYTLERGSINHLSGDNLNQYTTQTRSKDYIPIVQNTKYIATSYGVDGTTSSDLIRYYDSEKKFIGTSPNEKSTFLRTVFQMDIDNISHIQLEQGTAPTPYEPYKSSILSTLEPVELGSVGDVQDTFDLLTGDLTKRVYKIVFDESFKDRNVTVDEFENVYRFGVNADHISNNLSNDYVMKSMCDKFSVDTNYTGDYEHSYYWGAKFYFFISKNKLQGTANSFKTYITDNPITFQTICAEPVHKTVDLKVIDQNGNVIPTLKSWNTTTHIYSEIPENSLYPILSHSNPTYPVILKPSTKYSIVTNSYSNDHTNSAINFNLGGATASTTVGNRITTITTPSTLSNELLTMSGRGNKLNNVMVIEGDVAGDEPYFEGICDVKSPILSNVGKNLVNPNNYINYPNNNISVKKDGEHSYILENKTTGNWRYQIGDKVKLKANTTYTLSYDYELLSESVPMNYGAVINLRDESNPNKNISGDAVKGKPRTFTTTEDVIVQLAMYITDTSGGINKIKYYNIQVVEAPTVLDYEPYKSNILSANGDKIELTEDMFEQGGTITTVGVLYQNNKESNNARLRLKDIVKVKPNTTYRLKLSDNYQGYVQTYNKEKLSTSNRLVWSNDIMFTTTSSEQYVVISIRYTNNSSISVGVLNSNIITLSEVDKTIVLRSLQNEVCDTLNVETGEYIQKIGEVVFDGSSDEEMWYNSNWANGDYVACYWNVNAMSLPNKKAGAQNMVCDSFPTVTSSIVNTGGIVTGEGIWGEAGSSVMYISVNKAKLTELNVTGFRQWASQNPVIVQYELETPIVSTIDIQGFPYAYKDGHVQLSSGSIEQSLTPKVEYSLVANRNGQIEANTKSIRRHQDKLDDFEALMLTQMIQTHYEKTLLQFDFEMQMMALGGE